MEADRTRSHERFRVAGRYESLRQTLHSERYAGHLAKPLAYWALSSDRRLPLALLGRTLHELLARPFDEITATPGIGRKKIDSLLRLLARAANTGPEQLADDPLDDHGRSADAPWIAAEPSAVSANGFDPERISEVVWAKWRSAVVQHGWQDEPLGRLARSLRDLSRANWTIPLGRYADATLGDIRAMRTHGQKRTAAVLEVFHAVQKYASLGRPAAHLAARLRTSTIDQVERWVARRLVSPAPPSLQETLDRLVRPLIEQLRADAASQVVALAEGRLGLDGPVPSIRETARRMGLTRARIYQLLGEIHDIFAVRWPEGRVLLQGWVDHLAAVMSPDEPSDGLDRLRSVAQLFYPTTCRTSQTHESIRTEATGRPRA